LFSCSPDIVNSNSSVSSQISAESSLSHAASLPQESKAENISKWDLYKEKDELLLADDFTLLVDKNDIGWGFRLYSQSKNYDKFILISHPDYLFSYYVMEEYSKDRNEVNVDSKYTR
jgi:hypothetical protein